MIKILILILILLLVKTIYDKMIGNSESHTNKDNKNKIIDVEYEEVE